MVESNTEFLNAIPAFGYVRVSTADQEDKGTYENQERAIGAYAPAHGLSVVKWFKDLAVSGNDIDRPELNKMLDDLDLVKDIIIFDQSRLSRNFEFSLKLMFLFQKLGVKIHLAHENRIMDYNDDTVQLITSIQSWAAAQERKMIKARQKAGIQRYIETRGTWGRRKIMIDAKQYEALLKLGLRKSEIAQRLGISLSTLNRRVKGA